MTQAETTTDNTLQREAARIIKRLRADLRAGDDWFPALMHAVRDWPLPAETVGDRQYAYLVGGEAFDWLLLAERLLGEVEGLVPEDEASALLFEARIPVEGAGEEDLKAWLGAKHKAHLNFVWGVRVETALQLAVTDEVRKEHLSRVWENSHADDEVFTRIYGKPKRAMLSEYYARTKQRPTVKLSLAGLNEFTYFLFRYRVNNSDPARVASDTRKGVAQLERLDALRLRNPRG
jgi:hypothetical protein